MPGNDSESFVSMSKPLENPQAVGQPTQPRFGRMDLGLDQVVDGIQRAKEWLLG
jgi:squalene-hopene/tetraprenyl-beta-curcumene cyclase